MEGMPIGARQESFHSLRNMWSSKALESQRSPPKQKTQHSKHATTNTPAVQITTEPTEEKPPEKQSISLDTICSRVEQASPPPLPPNDDLSMPRPSSTVLFRQQARNVATLQQSVNKMAPRDKQQIVAQVPPTKRLHRWAITRHVVHTAIAFTRIRRASDSILPLLIKTQRANSTEESPFESCVDYLTSPKESLEGGADFPVRMNRSGSDASECVRRNRLDDAILQYTNILRHLKNYEQFTARYPVPSRSTAKQREGSFDSELIRETSVTTEEPHGEAAGGSRTTQSLSRNIGRTFANFIMHDLYLSPSPKSTVTEQTHPVLSHASSQTDLLEEKQEQTQTPTESIAIAEGVLQELDAMLDQESPSTPSDEIENVIQVPQAPADIVLEEIKVEPSLMELLFKGKKSAFTTDDLQLKAIRLPEEMLPTFEIAKHGYMCKRDKPVYVSLFRKVRRRSYTLHERMLLMTTERLYNLTKGKSQMKEVLQFREITGITCTPYKDGFICIHARESQDGRGDWLLVTDHPCELITQLFLAMGRNHNNDQFLKIKPKFTHCRRFTGEGGSVEYTIEAQLGSEFNIKKKNTNTVIIQTP